MNSLPRLSLLSALALTLLLPTAAAATLIRPSAALAPALTDPIRKLDQELTTKHPQTVALDTPRRAKNAPLPTPELRAYLVHNKTDWYVVVVNRTGKGSTEIYAYSYCRNNPLKYTDPTGMYSVPEFFTDVRNGITNISKTIVTSAVDLIQEPIRTPTHAIRVTREGIFGERLFSGGLSAHKTEAVSIDVFINESLNEASRSSKYPGRGRVYDVSYDELASQLNVLTGDFDDNIAASNLIGPYKRYVIDPLHNDRVVDMRHFLIIGRKWRVTGNAVELGQTSLEVLQRTASASGLTLLGIPENSGDDPQDYYSNELGNDFFRGGNYDSSKPFLPQLKNYFSNRTIYR